MRVVVVEDQILFQEFLIDQLRDKMGFEIAGIATDGEAALELILREKPDLVILDILIPKLSGIHVARRLLAVMPKLRIIALSAETDPKTVYQVNKQHLPAFIDKKEASVDVLRQAIEGVLARQRYYSPSIQAVLNQLRTDPKAFQKILTKREQEVLTLIGSGLSDREIGEGLGLSESSVQTHRRNLFRKLDVHSTPELIRYANECGFWKPAFPSMGLQDTYHVHD
ncbi:MAG: LuxR C-terminal-related transcriptional regulator [Puniceicoccaceae bacterium]